MRAYDVVFEVPAALDGQAHFALGVHDVDRGDGGEAVVGSRFEMVGRAGASAAVGGVALDDRAADLVYQRCDERRLQEVVSARFARREFDGHPPRGFAAERFVDAHQRLGRDRARQVDLGIRGLLLRRVVVRAGPPSAGACAQCQRQECRHPDSFHRIVEFRSSFSRLGNSSKLDSLGLTKRFVFSIGSVVFGRKSGDAFGSDTAKIAHRRFRSIIRITDCLTIITVVA